MNVEEFQRQKKIREFAKEHLPEMVRQRLTDRSISEVYSKESVKNNGEVYLGITVVPAGQEIAPCIYVESYIPPDPAVFQQEGVWEKVADRMAFDFRYALDTVEPKAEELFLEKDIKDKLILKVVNRDRNDKLLSMYPHKDFLDLSVLLEWEVTCGGRIGYIHISDAILQNWGQSFDEMYQVALENTMRKYPGKVEPLENVLRELIGDDNSICPHGILGASDSGASSETAGEETLSDFKSPFYYLGTSRSVQGVVVLLYPEMMKEVYRKIKEPFYVLPSSVNELLVLPCSFEPRHDRLKNLVWEVNTYVLDRADILSDLLYVYDPESDELKVLSDD